MKYVAHPFQGKKSNKRKVGNIIKKLVLHNSGVTYVSPIHAFGFMYEYVKSYEQGIEMCLELLSQSEELILCEGWEKSRGCRMEYDFAIKNNIKITFLQGD